EGMGPIAGDNINASYGFPRGALATFGSHRSRHGANKRFALGIYGSRGVVQLNTGSLPPVYFLDDPSWMPGKSKVAWQEVTSAGLGKPEKLKASGLGTGNVWIAKDLLEAIEK